MLSPGFLLFFEKVCAFSPHVRCSSTVPFDKLNSMGENICFTADPSFSIGQITPAENARGRQVAMHNPGGDLGGPKGSGFYPKPCKSGDD